VSLFVGRIERVQDTEAGRSGVVTVRGVLREVALDCVPGARVGDSVLVNAGVALSRLEDEGGDSGEDGPCA
jgi:hydrogenase expression/formation protein HypC